MRGEPATGHPNNRPTDRLAKRQTNQPTSCTTVWAANVWLTSQPADQPTDQTIDQWLARFSRTMRDGMTMRDEDADDKDKDEDKWQQR